MLRLSLLTFFLLSFNSSNVNSLKGFSLFILIVLLKIVKSNLKIDSNKKANQLVSFFHYLSFTIGLIKPSCATLQISSPERLNKFPRVKPLVSFALGDSTLTNIQSCKFGSL